MEANCRVKVPAALTSTSPPGKIIHGTNWSRGCMSPGTASNPFGETTLAPAGNRNHDSLHMHLVA